MKFTPIWLLPVILALIFWAVAEHFSTDSLAINRVFALTGISVLAITFILGPLPKFLPQANGLKAHRKFLGVAGFAIIALHAILSIVFYFSLDIALLLSLTSPTSLGMYSAFFAFLIFLLMGATTTPDGVKKLGFPIWTALHNTGYVALALAMAHVIIMEASFAMPIPRQPAAAFVFLFSLITLLLRILVFVFVHFAKKPNPPQSPPASQMLPAMPLQPPPAPQSQQPANSQ